MLMVLSLPTRMKLYDTEGTKLAFSGCRLPLDEGPEMEGNRLGGAEITGVEFAQEMSKRTGLQGSLWCKPQHSVSPSSHRVSDPMHSVGKGAREMWLYL